MRNSAMRKSPTACWTNKKGAGVVMKTCNILIIFSISAILVSSCGGEDRTDRIKELYSAENGVCLDAEDCENGYYCEDNVCVDTFSNYHDGKYWSDKAPNKMNHADAITYCEGLGGHLPTISELRTLIQNCSKTETGGSCNVTDSCLSYSECRNDNCSGCDYDSSGKYSFFGDTGWFWSSSVLSGYADDAWSVRFDYGFVLSASRSSNYNVRCLR